MVINKLAGMASAIALLAAPVAVHAADTKARPAAATTAQDGTAEGADMTGLFIAGGVAAAVIIGAVLLADGDDSPDSP